MRARIVTPKRLLITIGHSNGIDIWHGINSVRELAISVFIFRSAGAASVVVGEVRWMVVGFRIRCDK